MFAVMWSEHCGYKYSRPVLSRFKTYSESLEKGSLENAGLLDLGKGHALAFKIESHNHPSAVEPYQGAATGVGGIIRDVLTMGARPIAGLNSLRFGTIKGDSVQAVRNRYLLEGVVSGISGYGNCIGVPTVGGEVSFDPGYDENPLVNAMCVGILKSDEIASAGTKLDGGIVIYLGSATGRDGIHGATFASEELTEESESKRPNVQIGDPFAGKSLIEATLEALATGAIEAIQDMGAAGLTCATIEMSAKNGMGMKVDLDLVPIREDDMTAEEIMLSESQERMLAVAYPGREQEVIDIFHKWGLKAVAIGTTSTSGRVEIMHRGEAVADLIPGYLADECPSYTNEKKEPESFEKRLSFSAHSIEDIPQEKLADVWLDMLANPRIASKRWVYEQYDFQVQTQTVFGPGRDSAVLVPRGVDCAIAISVDGNERWVESHPYRGGIAVVCEAARNVACQGASPKAITDGLNFGSPTDPVVYWQFDECVRGMAEAVEALDTPVLSGNVSLYNEGMRSAIPPTPMIGMVGVADSYEAIIDSKCLGIPSSIGILSYEQEVTAGQGLGASAYLYDYVGERNGVLEPVDPELERKLCDVLVELAKAGLIHFSHDVSEGGIAVALAEIFMDSQMSAEIDLSNWITNRTERRDSALFGEWQGAVIMGFKESSLEEIQNVLPDGINLGVVGSCFKDESGSFFSISSENWHVRISSQEAKSAYEGSLPGILRGRGPNANKTTANRL